MKSKPATIILLIGLLIWGWILFGGENAISQSNEPKNNLYEDNVRIEDGKQIITIRAKGGYYPRKTEAKAEIPTIIRMETNGTFDCSSALVIPSLKYRKSLPISGITEIEVPAQKAGSTLDGLCSMGMYNFAINFD
ncbi:MAG: hypothetical protein AAB392_02260 [Patescibacteria group bacterium]